MVGGRGDNDLNGSTNNVPQRLCHSLRKATREKYGASVGPLYLLGILVGVQRVVVKFAASIVVKR